MYHKMHIVTNNFPVMLWGLIIEHEGIGGLFLERDNINWVATIALRMGIE